MDTEDSYVGISEEIDVWDELNDVDLEGSSTHIHTDREHV